MTQSDIERIALFRGVEPAAVLDAIKGCEIRILPAGSVLLERGQANDTIFVLLSGEAAGFLDSARLSGATFPFHVGDSIGMSAIDAEPVSASVVALTQARVLVLPGALFWNRIATLPGVTRNLLAELAERTRRGNEAMLESQRTHLELEHVRKELGIARQLQADMIPGRGRLFPERADIEVAGAMTPASEVGGDFFDAFFVDDTRLFFCVGDVSGHGIPAALFMARTVGLIRIAAMAMRDPGRLLERVNEQLCAGNDASVFTTLFCAFLDVASGRLVYGNAGHCAPILVADGNASMLAIPRGALAGAMPGRSYASKEASLDRGVTLVCYTDGVIEAESKAGQAFSTDRLLGVLAANGRRSAADLLDCVERELAGFVGTAGTADDCTLLIVRRP